MLMLMQELQIGDVVDLEGDRFADPDGSNDFLKYELVTIEDIERETGDCTCIYFQDFDAVGFPVDYMLDVKMRHDPDTGVQYDPHE